MDFLAAQRFIESFIRIPGEHYPTVEQVQDDPWTSAEWLLSSQMASCDRDYVTSTATFLTHLTSPGPVGMSSCECAMATEVFDFSPQFGGRNLREPGLCGSPSESCIGSLTPSRDPCRCKSLGATYSAALNRLQEAYLPAQVDPQPRYVWQRLGLFGCGILATPTTVRAFLDTFVAGQTTTFQNASAVWAGGCLLQHFIFALEGPRPMGELLATYQKATDMLTDLGKLEMDAMPMSRNNRVRQAMQATSRILEDTAPEWLAELMRTEKMLVEAGHEWTQ